jgi:hypothetical protein
MWNLCGMYRAALLMTVTKEISEYNLVEIEVKWDRGGTKQVGEYIFLWKAE